MRPRLTHARLRIEPTTYNSQLWTYENEPGVFIIMMYRNNIIWIFFYCTRFHNVTNCKVKCFMLIFSLWLPMALLYGATQKRFSQEYFFFKKEPYELYWEMRMKKTKSCRNVFMKESIMTIPSEFKLESIVLFSDKSTHFQLNLAFHVTYCIAILHQLTGTRIGTIPPTSSLSLLSRTHGIIRMRIAVTHPTPG